MAENQYLVTTSPHIKSEEDVSTVMGTVAIALAPAFIFALYRFGYYALVVTGLAVLSAVVCEAICQRLRGQPVTVNDWSAVVTGLLLAAVIPPNVSWFVPVIGSVVAIGITKHCFGGLGSNIWNPALMGRAFLQAAFPTQINSGVWPAVSSDSMGDTVSTSIHGSFAELVTQSQQSGSDIITSATPWKNSPV